MSKYISAIVPVYNEEKRILNTLQALKKISLINQIIVVDDGSVDATTEKVRKAECVTLLSLPENKGKGKALKIGVQEALKKADIILFVDGDLEETAIEAEKLLEPVLNEITDVAIAKFPPAKKKGGFGFVKKLARNGVYFYTGKKLTSVLSGQRAFSRKVLEDVPIIYGGYGIELGMTIDILKKGYTITEVSVDMTHHETGRNFKGFCHRGKQFFQILKVLIMKLFQR